MNTSQRERCKKVGKASQSIISRRPGPCYEKGKTLRKGLTCKWDSKADHFRIRDHMRKARNTRYDQSSMHREDKASSPVSLFSQVYEKN